MTPPTPPAVDERVLIRVSFRSHPAPLPWALRAQCRSREQEANAMTLDSRFRRRLPLAAGLVLVLVALGAAFGYGRAATTPWSDQPIAVAPTTVTAPDWVALAQALKPAVVNVSMKRAAQATPEAPDPFFQPFFGRVPPRVQRGLGSGFVITAAGDAGTTNPVGDAPT